MNPELKVVVGLFFLLLGLGYLYRPGLIQRMNEFIREQLFNDARISLERRKWGIFFLLLSLLFIYMGWQGMRAG
ncbi:MAG: hypothetical protein HY924_06765 [Elusimicrobia bacterium]|nr:hypothetical protein [Elusimicrobiota bacterium]